MKRFLLPLCGAFLALASCSDEKAPLPSLSDAVQYSGSNLKVYYCGELMPAKEVSYKPSASDKQKGVLSCKGITDLSQLSSIGMSGIGAAPGVLPGSKELDLPISLSVSDDKYVFSGAGNTPFISEYAYNGKLQGDSCVLNIDKVQLANLDLGGSIWVPSPIKRDGLSFTSLPFRLVWELDPAAGIDIDLSQLLELVVTVPVIPVYHDTAYSSIAQLYTNALQTVAFNENGNIFLRYYSSVGGATQLMTSVGNTLQYVIPQSGTLLLYPNPTTIFGRWLVAQSDAGDDKDISFTSSRADSASSADDEVKALLIEFLKVFLPVVLDNCANGFPFIIERSGDQMSLYLDTPVIIEMLSQAVGVIEQNPDLMQKLLEKLGLTAEGAELAESLQQLLPQLKSILLNTTKIQIGFNFNAYKS